MLPLTCEYMKFELFLKDVYFVIIFTKWMETPQFFFLSFFPYLNPSGLLREA